MIRSVLGGIGWVFVTAGMAMFVSAFMGGWDDCPSGRENPMGPHFTVTIAVGSVAIVAGFVMMAFTK